LVALVDSLADEIDGERLRPLAADLDLHYVPARYPNGLPDLAPFQAYTREQAERAIAGAMELVNAALARETA
jgi:HEPN domain-containing protein